MRLSYSSSYSRRGVLLGFRGEGFQEGLWGWGGKVLGWVWGGLGSYDLGFKRHGVVLGFRGLSRKKELLGFSTPEIVFEFMSSGCRRELLGV
jgi:hypothetical protein